jgi:hypothetical protein
VPQTLPQKKRVRRLVTAADCTLMSDPSNETLAQSVLISDVSAISPSEPSADTKYFIRKIIEVFMMLIAVVNPKE